MNLIPEQRTRGEHGEQLDTALIEDAIAILLDLATSIDGADSSLMDWLNRKAETGEPIRPEQISQSLAQIHAAICRAHVKISAARKRNPGPAS